MSWQRARFKGQDVWAEVEAPGQPKVEGGRVPIRYQARPGAKVYRASVDRVELDPSASPEDLEGGVSADAASAPSGAAKTPSKGTPGGYGKAGTRTAAQAAMAVEAAQRLVAEMEGRGVLCFTDGSCRGNPGPAGSGACVWLPNGRRGEASRTLGTATNNVAELTAIGLALELLDEEGIPLDHPGAVFTDSAYAHGVLARGWKAKANRELVELIRSALARRPAIELHWIAGHVGIEGNERADALANAGVDGATVTKWSKS